MEAETRAELEATLAARRELGPGHDDALIDGFLERLDRRLEERRPPQPVERSEDERGMHFVAALVSLGVAIPITAIVISHGLLALAIVWVGIVFVNVAFARAVR